MGIAADIIVIIVPVRQMALVGMPIQILLTVGLGMGIGYLLGWEWKPSLWLGALISLSSTMVLLKTLMSQGWLGTLRALKFERRLITNNE